MKTWQKILGWALGIIISVCTILGFIYTWSGKATMVTNNANEVPALQKDFRDHQEEDHIKEVKRDAMFEALVTQLTDVCTKVNALTDELKEMNRNKKYNEFNNRKNE